MYYIQVHVQRSTLEKYFELNDKKLNKEIKQQGKLNIQHQNKYHMNYGNCTLTYIPNKCTQHNIEIPGIIHGGLCFTLPIILPYLCTILKNNI